MKEFDTTLRQQQLRDLADETPPPHGLAVAAVGRAQQVRRRQVLGVAATVLALGLGVGGLTSVLSDRSAPSPGTLPDTSVPTTPGRTTAPGTRPPGQVLGRMPRAVAVVWRGGEGYGVDSAGRETPLVRFDSSPTGSAVLSPDGTRLAVPGAPLSDYRAVGLWVMDLPTGRVRVLPAQGDQLMSAFWSPDGLSVVGQRYGGGRVWLIEPASGKAHPVPGFTGDVNGWAADGRRILASQNLPEAGGSAGGSAGAGEQHVWFWLDPATGTQERLPGLDGWSGLGDQGGLPDPSATGGSAPTDAPATLTGWVTAGVPSPDGRLLPFERPTPDGLTELTVVDVGTGRQVRTWRLPQSDASGQWTAWLDDGTLLAAEHPPGAALTVDRLSVTTGARDRWRSFTGADAVTTAATVAAG